MRILVKLYDKTLEWSKHRFASHYLALVSFVEASVFPIPPYFMLAPMSLAKPNKALRYAFIATLASVLGGSLGYLLGFLVFKPLILPVIEYFNYLNTYQLVVEKLQNQGFWTILIAGFMPIPFKIIAISAGFMHVPIILFLFSSLFGRGIKFYLLAIIIKLGGSYMEQKLRFVLDKLGIVILIVLGTIVTIFVFK